MPICLAAQSGTAAPIVRPIKICDSVQVCRIYPQLLGPLGSLKWQSRPYCYGMPDLKLDSGPEGSLNVAWVFRTCVQEFITQVKLKLPQDPSHFQTCHAA